MLEQSASLCFILAALGGCLEVGSTAVLAVPDAREQEGVKFSELQKLLFLAANISLQLVGSLSSNLFAAWFGPVSIVGPISLSSQLVSNMVIFGFLLGLEFFTDNMRIGTWVVVVATILLPVVGPGVQEDQDVFSLLMHWYTLAWLVLLQVGMFVTCVLLVLGISRYKRESTKIAVLLVCRSTSFAVNLTVSRAIILIPGKYHALLVTSIVVKIVSGAIYSYAIVVQSTAVEQSKFVPLNATITIVMNAITGIILWEDWKVMGSWVGYACVFWLLGIGCNLLLSVPLMTTANPNFGYGRRNTMLRHQRATRSLMVKFDVSDEEDEEPNGEKTPLVRGLKKSSVTEESSPGMYLSGYVEDKPKGQVEPSPAPERKSTKAKDPKMARKNAWRRVTGFGDNLSHSTLKFLSTIGDVEEGQESVTGSKKKTSFVSHTASNAKHSASKAAKTVSHTASNAKHSASKAAKQITSLGGKAPWSADHKKKPESDQPK